MREKSGGKRTLFIVMTFVFLFLLGSGLSYAQNTVIGIDHEDPVVAAGGPNNEALVVFVDRDNFDLLAQRVNASGVPIGGPTTVDSLVGNDDGDLTEVAAVTYNPVTNDYLVAWEDEDLDNNNSPGDDDDDGDIFVQRINAATGALNGGRVLVSNPQGAGNDFNDDARAGVAYNSTNNTYLVVWIRDDVYEDEVCPPNLLQAGEVQGRLVNADLSLPGSVQSYGTSSGGEDSPNDDIDVDVAYNSVNNEFLVVWEQDNVELCDQDVVDPVDIQARYASNTGAPLGAQFSPDSAATLDADDPKVAHSGDAGNNFYLVVWENDQLDDEDGEKIIGRYIAGNQGGTVGSNFNVTPDSSDDRDDPDVSYCPVSSSFFVVFENNDEESVEGRSLPASGPFEDIFTIAFDPTLNDDDDITRDDPRVDFSGGNNTFMVVMENDDESDGQAIFVEADTVGCPTSGLDAIPTLTHWGIGLLFLLVAGSAMWMIRRKRAA